jgi:hypothetical protein
MHEIAWSAPTTQTTEAAAKYEANTSYILLRLIEPRSVTLDVNRTRRKNPGAALEKCRS